MVFKLYGSLKSPYARLVAAILLEKQVPFEMVPVDIPKGENKSPEYLRRNPFGQVPSIDDDGFILYESKAICYYVASKYANQGTPLLPTGIEANALYQQAVFVEAAHFNIHALPAAKEIIYKRGPTPNKEALEKHVADLNAQLDVYDKILSKQKYLVGDEITLVDFYYLPVGTTLGLLGLDIMESKSKPNVARWFKDIASRHSWLTMVEEAKSIN